MIPGFLRRGGVSQRGRSFQVPFDFDGGGAVSVSRSSSTWEKKPTVPGSLRRGRSNLRFQVPFDVGEATSVSRSPSTWEEQHTLPGSLRRGRRSKPWNTHPQQRLFRHSLLMLQQRERVLFPGNNTFSSPVGEDSDDLLKSIRDLFAYSGSPSNRWTHLTISEDCFSTHL